MNKRNRILVWGLSNNKAGTEAVINSYASIITDVPFDFITFEQPKNYNGLFTQDKDNRYFIIHSKSKNPIQYYIDLNQFMNDHAHEYRALWFNTNHAANIDLLKLAKRYSIPRRIVHSHNSQDPEEPILKVLCHINANACVKMSTERWACSTPAGDYLFHGASFKLVPNLVDSNACSFDSDKRKLIRGMLHLGNSLVIGNVGRLCHQKNHSYLIDLLDILDKQGINCHLVIVGEGELQNSLLKKAEDKGLLPRIHLVGVQRDIQAYLSAFDVFVFPSLYEGLPVSLLEAQFNGVPCICSDCITNDAVISHQTYRIPLDQIDRWIDVILSSRRRSNPLLNSRASSYDLNISRKFATHLFS